MDLVRRWKAGLAVVAGAGIVMLVAGSATAAPPVAVDDALTAGRNTPTTINVLTNDTDADADKLEVAYVTGSDKGGTVDCEVTGECIFYAGPVTTVPYADSFDYEVTDGKGGVDIGTVTVQVIASSPSPSPSPSVSVSPSASPSVSVSPSVSPSPSASPSPSPSPSPTIPTVHARSITLKLRGLRALGRITVGDGFDACATGQRVKIQRKQDGRFRTIKTVTTSSSGSYSTKLRKAGRYRANAAATDECTGAKSPVRKLTL